MEKQVMPAQRIPASMWRERIGHWRASGLSLTAYAEQFSYPVERLRYWSQRLSREERAAPFVPLRVQPSPRLTRPAVIEVRGPSGWLVQLDGGADPAWLAALLSELR